MLVYYVWKLATALGRALPLRVCYGIAALAADLVFLCWSEKRNNAIANMRHVLADAPPVEARRVARESFRNYGRYLIDFIRAPMMDEDYLSRRIEFTDWEGLDAVFAEGRGLIFVLLHFGSWDMAGVLFSKRGYPLHAIVDRFEHSKLDDMVAGTRMTAGMHIIPVDRAGIRVVRALRKNEALAILLDRPQAPGGIAVRFFNALTVLPSGAARLALRTDARIVPVAIVRVDPASDRLRAILDLDFRFERSGDAENDVRLLTEAILRVHEGIIRRFPDQWYMFRRMWPKQGLPSTKANRDS